MPDRPDSSVGTALGSRVRGAPALVTRSSWRGWSAVGGGGRGQLKSVSGAGRVRLCGHVKLSALNSAVIPELTTGGWESGLPLQALLPAGPNFPDPSIQSIRTKIIKK